MELLRPQRFFDEQSAQNLRDYKYRGIDEGWFYLHFFSPLADRLVAMTPEWVAPNLLTFLGAVSV